MQFFVHKHIPKWNIFCLFWRQNVLMFSVAHSMPLHTLAPSLLGAQWEYQEGPLFQRILLILVALLVSPTHWSYVWLEPQTPTVTDKICRRELIWVKFWYSSSQILKAGLQTEKSYTCGLCFGEPRPPRNVIFAPFVPFSYSWAGRKFLIDSSKWSKLLLSPSCLCVVFTIHGIWPLTTRIHPPPYLSFSLWKPSTLS